MIKVSSGKVFHIIIFFVCVNNALFALLKRDGLNAFHVQSAIASSDGVCRYRL